MYSGRSDFRTTASAAIEKLKVKLSTPIIAAMLIQITKKVLIWPTFNTKYGLRESNDVKTKMGKRER